jgi:hypothetical protein
MIENFVEEIALTQDFTGIFRTASVPMHLLFYILSLCFGHSVCDVLLRPVPATLGDWRESTTLRSPSSQILDRLSSAPPSLHRVMGCTLSVRSPLPRKASGSRRAQSIPRSCTPIRVRKWHCHSADTTVDILCLNGLRCRYCLLDYALGYHVAKYQLTFWSEMGPDIFVAVEPSRFISLPSKFTNAHNPKQLQTHKVHDVTFNKTFTSCRSTI